MHPEELEESRLWGRAIDTWPLRTPGDDEKVLGTRGPRKSIRKREGQVQRPNSELGVHRPSRLPLLIYTLHQASKKEPSTLWAVRRKSLNLANSTIHARTYTLVALDFHSTEHPPPRTAISVQFPGVPPA